MTPDRQQGVRPMVTAADPLPGLIDLALSRGADGALRHPDTLQSIDVHGLAELVHHHGGADKDVRVLLDDGARDNELFTSLANLLSRDVLVVPADATLPDPRHPVPVRRFDGKVVDWTLIQPPAFATDLPGWFDLSGGSVRLRSGPIVLALPDGVLVSTRENFVRHRATVARIVAGPPGLTTVGVPVREGGFLISEHSGAETVYGGADLAAILAAYPLYAGDLRLWLTWPDEPSHQHLLDRHLTDLAGTSGATIWVPPTDGVVVVVDGELAVRGRAGHPDEWWPYRPNGRGGPAAFRSDVDGRLVPAVGAVPTSAVVTPTGDEGVSPYARHEAPTSLADGRRRHGLSWLPKRPRVNGEALTLYVMSAWAPDRVAREGVPTAELFLLGHTERGGHRLNRAPYVLRLRAEPGTAVPAAAARACASAEVTAALAGPDTYVLPAGWLDRVRLEASVTVDEAGTINDEVVLPGHPLILRSTDASHGVDGLPDDLTRWPSGATPQTAWSLLPEGPDGPPRDLLPLYRKAPPPQPGLSLVQLRVKAAAAIDVAASAGRLLPLTSVRTRLTELQHAGIALALPRAAGDAAEVIELLQADGARWRSNRGSTPPTSLSLFDDRFERTTGQTAAGKSPVSTAVTISTRDR
ncbi:hypothetical protein [Micromonospora chokoriensis]